MKVQTLFGEEDLEWWKPYWQDMPEFVQEDLEPIQQIIISFEFYEDVVAFGKLMNQTVTPFTQSMWFPKQNRDEPKNYLYVNES